MKKLFLCIMIASTSNFCFSQNLEDLAFLKFRDFYSHDLVIDKLEINEKAIFLSNKICKSCVVQLISEIESDLDTIFLLTSSPLSVHQFKYMLDTYSENSTKPVFIGMSNQIPEIINWQLSPILFIKKKRKYNNNKIF